MSTQVLKAAFLAAMALGTSCDPPPSGLQLPACADRQAIGFDDSGNPTCQELGQHGDPPPLPVCTSDEALTLEGGTVRCVQRTDATGLRELRQQATELADLIAQAASALDQVKPRAVATFAGLTKQQSTGRIVFGGQIGLRAAALYCEQDFGPGSHLCTPYELHLSASLGVIRPTDAIARSWVHAPAWNRSAALVNADRDAGLGDTCAGYIYQTSSAGYRGVISEWTTLPTGATGLVLHGGDDAPCYSYLPLACCR
jgi:hypothetical protein